MKARLETTALFLAAGALVALPLIFSAKPPAGAPGPVGVGPGPGPVPVEPEKPEPRSDRRIQVALLLDTSSSMDGLIDQAKAQLWRIVNELGTARRGGERPRLEIALYEYGKSGLEPMSGFVRQILPLTGDLDLVSEKLFELSTNGGEEYCGHAIQSATQGLGWSPSPADLKLIFIAGNEPFTQGSVDYASAIRGAQAKGITVNTIFCGPESEGVATGWRDGAVLAEGRYLSIDQDVKVAHIDAPQDGELARLSSLINTTYVPYGALGAQNVERQAAQDQNASSLSLGSFLQRGVSKASAAYSNPSWDLVDAKEAGNLDVAKLEDTQLPPELRGMSPGERLAYVEAKAKERAELKARIQALNAERTRYVAEQQKVQAQAGSTLDEVLVAAVRAQASKSGYKFE